MSVKATTAGIIIPVKNRGKDNKIIPWSMVKKEIVAPCVKRCTNDDHNVDIYLVEKTIDGNRLEGVFETKRDAFRAVDVFLIQNGREPELILKRV